MVCFLAVFLGSLLPSLPWVRGVVHLSRRQLARCGSSIEFSAAGAGRTGHTPGGTNKAWANEPCTKCTGSRRCANCKDQMKKAFSKARQKGKKAAAATRALPPDGSEIFCRVFPRCDFFLRTQVQPGAGTPGSNPGVVPPPGLSWLLVLQPVPIEPSRDPARS